MLSYMLPVEEKSPSARNLSLNLNLQSTTSQSQTSSDTDQHEHEDADENTKLLSMEREEYVATKITNRNGNLIKNGGGKINYSMNITHNNLINSSSSTDHNNINNNNNSIIKNGDSMATDADAETDSVATTTTIENTVNNNLNEETNSSNGDNKKIIKMTKLGSKNVTLKRVSFGSSKGSMVETLIFETPTPLPEHAEREFFSSVAPTAEESNGLNDSGIELQEELERSKVRVSFFQSSKPQQISPPCSENQLLLFYGDNIYNNNSLIDSFLHNSTLSETDSNRMTAVLPPDYNRQASTDSGWDNPFRPDGDLSREADEIVNMIKGGKPITPTGDQSLLNGTHVNGSLEANGTAVVDGATKLEASPLLTQQNGTKSPQKGAANGEATKEASQTQTQVSNQTVPGPQSASHVVIDEKKKKGRACCVIQ